MGCGLEKINWQLEHFITVVLMPIRLEGDLPCEVFIRLPMILKSEAGALHMLQFKTGLNE